MIQFFFEDVDPIEINTKTNEWLQELITREQKKVGKITYIFMSDDGLLKVIPKMIVVSPPEDFF